MMMRIVEGQNKGTYINGSKSARTEERKARAMDLGRDSELGALLTRDTTCVL